MHAGQRHVRQAGGHTRCAGDGGGASAAASTGRAWGGGGGGGGVGAAATGAVEAVRAAALAAAACARGNLRRPSPNLRRPSPNLRLPPSPPDNFNWCSVPLKGSDAFLFAALALVCAAVLFGKLSAVWVLIAGGWAAASWLVAALTWSLRGAATRLAGPRAVPTPGWRPPLPRALLLAGGVVGAVNNYVHLREVSNAITIWLGISPPDLFFFAVSAGGCLGEQAVISSCCVHGARGAKQAARRAHLGGGPRCLPDGHPAPRTRPPATPRAWPAPSFCLRS